MKSILKKLCSVFLVLCMVMSLLPMTALAAGTSDLRSTIEGYSVGSETVTAAVYGNTVTVTGTITNATEGLTLDIDPDVTVIWKASITSDESFSGQLIFLTGDGTFEVAEGGEVCTTKGTSIYATGTNATVTVSGGTVNSARNSIVSYGASSTVTVSGGTVNTDLGTAIYTQGINATVTVSGGTVNSESGMAIYTEGINAKVAVRGGIVSNSATDSTYPVIHMKYNGSTIDNMEVSGDGKVLAKGNKGCAIRTYGNVTVKDSAQVSATTGIAIDTHGASSAVTVNGGTVNSGTVNSESGYYAIYATGTNATVTVSGGTVSNSVASPNYAVIYMSNENNTIDNVEVSGDGKVLAQGDNGRAIKTYGNVTVKDSAQVSATTGNAVCTYGASSKITVSGGTVNSESGYAIYAEGTNATVTVSGGAVSATTGTAVCTYGASSAVEVNGGTVDSESGYAIYTNGASSTVTVSGGAVFAYGTAITGLNQIIYLPYNASGFTGPTGNGVVVAWNQEAGTTKYGSGSNDDLLFLPDTATVKWAKQGDHSGIFYTNGTNTGFFAVDGITVIKSPVTVSQLSFTNPSNLSHTYNGSQQGIGTVTAASGITLGEITVYYTKIDDTIHSSTEAPTNAGTYQVTANVAESDDYIATVWLALGNYTIAKADPPSITWPTAAEITYGGTLSDSLLSGGSTEYGDFAWADGTVVPHVNNSGYEVTFTPSKATLQNYKTITDTTRTVSITVAKATVTGVDQTYQVLKGYAKEYSFDLTTLLPAGVDASQISGYVCSNSTNNNNIFSNTPSVSGTTLTLPVASVDTAELADTVTIGFISDNYSISSATITVKTVDKTPVTITADISGRVYNGQPYAYSNAVVTLNTDDSDVTGSVTLEASYEGIDGTTYSPSADAPTDAGSYRLTLSLSDSDAAYTGSATFSFTIAQRPITVKADDKSMTKGGTLPTFTYAVEGQLSGETVLSGTPALDCTADGSTAGSFDITVDMTGVTYTANYKAAEPAFVSGTLTVRNPSSGGGSSSGRSSGTTAPSITVSGSTATTTATARTDSKGNASASVTQAQVDSAIEAAQKAARSNGEAPKVEIQVSGGSDASTVEITLPKSAVQALVTDKMESLTLSGPVATMTFDAQAIAAIANAASGNTAFTASSVESSSLSDAARQLVGERPVYEFSVQSGSKTISRFDGTVTVSLPYTPAAGEDVNAIVAYYINADGELELMKNCYYDAEAGALVFTTNHFSKYAVGYNKIAFSDVSDMAWYADAVSYLAAREITSGTNETTFSPDATLTRGQFITLLMRAYEIDPDENSTDNFSDAGNTYYTGYLAAAKRLGISKGVGDNKFAPEQATTRQQMFTLLYNGLKAVDQLPEVGSGKTLSDFTDSGSVSSYAQEAMSYLVKAGAVSGNNGYLLPTETTTRAQMAQVLYNLLKK